jgi:hypothetical protein
MRTSAIASNNLEPCGFDILDSIDWSLRVLLFPLSARDFETTNRRRYRRHHDDAHGLQSRKPRENHSADSEIRLKE